MPNQCTPEKWRGAAFSAEGCQAKEGPLRLVHFGDQSRRFSFDGVRLIPDASAGTAPPSLMARDVTPLAAARARPPAPASTRARSSRSRASGAPRSGSRLRPPDRLSSRRTRRTIRPRARELRRAGRWRRALCSARAGRGPTFPCPSRALHPRAFVRGRWPVMAYYRPRAFHFPLRFAPRGPPHASGALSRPSHNACAMC